VTAPVTEFSYEQSSKPTAEFSSNASEATSDVSAQSSEFTANSARRTADVSTKSAASIRETSRQSSGVSDASLEKTIRITWKNYQVHLLDPDIADALVKEAYAFKGPLLSKFSQELSISTEQLAHTIIEVFPPQAKRSQLQRLFSYVIPKLELAFYQAANSKSPS